MNKIGRLYFRYILRSKLEAYGYTAKQLGKELEEMGLIKIDPTKENYEEIQKLPIKRELINSIMQRNQYNEPMKGMVTKLESDKGELLGQDKKIYLFDKDSLKGIIQVGDQVTFKQAYKNNSLQVARDITKD